MRKQTGLYHLVVQLHTTPLGGRIQRMRATWDRRIYRLLNPASALYTSCVQMQAHFVCRRRLTT